MQRNLLAGLAAATVAAVLLAACSDAKITTPAGGGGTAGGAGIAATGTGRVTGTPDTATVNLGVQVRADTAAAALDRANQGAAAVIDVLRRNGVDEADIATSNLSIYPVYDENGQRVTGYEASNTVTATLRDVDGAGTLIDATARAAGDDVVLNGISFSISDTGEMMQQARQQAVEAAQAQAEELAAAAGVSLGELISLTESGGVTPPVPYATQADMGGGVPIEPGTQELSLTVTAVYAIGG
ncbi:MAG: SIMPL domain-containing protein [Acidimicrobiales bacterium]|nr:SIMPL domain-containing protein [Acidimicrobiales bacterium]